MCVEIEDADCPCERTSDEGEGSHRCRGGEIQTYGNGFEELAIGCGESAGAWRSCGQPTSAGAQWMITRSMVARGKTFRSCGRSGIAAGCTGQSGSVKLLRHTSVTNLEPSGTDCCGRVSGRLLRGPGSLCCGGRRVVRARATVVHSHATPSRAPSALAPDSFSPSRNAITLDHNHAKLRCSAGSGMPDAQGVSLSGRRSGDAPGFLVQYR